MPTRWQTQANKPLKRVVFTGPSLDFLFEQIPPADAPPVTVGQLDVPVSDFGMCPVCFRSNLGGHGPIIECDFCLEDIHVECCRIWVYWRKILGRAGSCPSCRSLWCPFRYGAVPGYWSSETDEDGDKDADGPSDSGGGEHGTGDSNSRETDGGGATQTTKNFQHQDEDAKVPTTARWAAQSLSETLKEQGYASEKGTPISAANVGTEGPGEDVAEPVVVNWPGRGALLAEVERTKALAGGTPADDEGVGGLTEGPPDAPSPLGHGGPSGESAAGPSPSDRLTPVEEPMACRDVLETTDAVEEMLVDPSSQETDSAPIESTASDLAPESGNTAEEPVADAPRPEGAVVSSNKKRRRSTGGRRRKYATPGGSRASSPVHTGPR